jgi:hypothetical protein
MSTVNGSLPLRERARVREHYGGLGLLATIPRRDWRLDIAVLLFKFPFSPTLSGVLFPRT